MSNVVVSKVGGDLAVRNANGIVLESREIPYFRKEVVAGDASSAGRGVTLSTGEESKMLATYL